MVSFQLRDTLSCIVPIKRAILNAVRNVTIKLCAHSVLLWFGISASVLFPGAYANVDTLPNPTIQAIIENTPPGYVRVRWLDSNHLIAEIRGDEENENYAVIYPIVGEQAHMIGTGEFVSVSPDGSFIAQRQDERWIIRSATGETLHSIVLPPDNLEAGNLLSSEPVWSRDGRFLAIAQVHRPNLAAKASNMTKVNGVNIVDIGETLKASGKTTTKIYVFDTRNIKSKPTQLTIKGDARNLAWGGQDRLFFVRNRFHDYADENVHTAVFAWNILTSDVDEVYRTRGRMQFMYPAVSPDGRWLAVALDVDTRLWESFVSLIVVDIESGEERRLTDTLRVKNLGGDRAYVWARDSQSLYFVARHGVLDRIYNVELDGTLDLISVGERKHFDLQISPSGRMLSYQTLDGYGRRDVRIRSLQDDTEYVVKQIDDPTLRFKLGKFQQVQWANGEGQDIFGYLILPHDFDPIKSYPTLVYVHGGGPGSRLDLQGPLTRSIVGGPLEWHAWAGLGYVVFIPDYGSTGSYGAETVLQRYREGDFSGIQADVRDVESGVRHLIRNKYIDRNRIAIFGHSAGAARVIALLTKSSLFHAAILNETITGGPLSSLIRSTTGPYTGRKFESTYAPILGGRLSEKPQRYYDDFLLDSYKIKTPTLILVGGNKARSATFPLASEFLFTVLQEYEVPSRMLRFVDEGHVYLTPIAVVVAFDEMHKWLRTHMPPTSL